MRKPDCFIEVSIVPGGESVDFGPYHMGVLENVINASKVCGIRTIAIFKIYLKNKPKA